MLYFYLVDLLLNYASNSPVNWIEVIANGVGANFGVGIGEARPKDREWGMGFLGRGSQPLPTN